MKRILPQRIFGFSQLAAVVLLIALLPSLSSLAAISEGPKPKNAVEEQQRQKLLFDQAILSNQEKLRVGQERYDARQVHRAKVLQTMTAQLEARQQAIAIQPVATAPVLIFEPSHWLKPLLTLLLLLVIFICARYLHLSRKREQAAAEREKLF